MLKQEMKFDAPIPGMSLTHELGARPWQSPPQYSTVDDTIDYYLERMSTDEFESQLIDVLRMDVPVTVISDTIIQSSVMEGVHTIDVGVLVAPILVEFIMLIGDSEGVEYITGLDEDAQGPTQAMVNRAISDLRKARKENDKGAEEEPKVVEQPKEEIKEEPSGLMARRS
jgi:hypothetical protein